MRHSWETLQENREVGLELYRVLKIRNRDPKLLSGKVIRVVKGSKHSGLFHFFCHENRIFGLLTVKICLKIRTLGS